MYSQLNANPRRWFGFASALLAIAFIPPLFWLYLPDWVLLRPWEVPYAGDLFYWLPASLSATFTLLSLRLLKGKVRSLPKWDMALQGLQFGCSITLMLSVNHISAGQSIWPSLLAIGWALVNLVRLLHCLLIRHGERSRVLHRATLVLGGMFFALLMGEAAFSFFTQSHNFFGTLSARNWKGWYMRHNAAGYRDAEWPDRVKDSDKVIVFLGDSFTEGHGIQDPKDRFSEVAARGLGEGYRVFNLGLGGSDVGQAADRLEEFPFRVDQVVYQWFVNDLDYDCGVAGEGVQTYPIYAEVPAPLRFVLRRSYLLNFFYWRMPRRASSEAYQRDLDACLAHAATRELHLRQIARLAEVARRKGASRLTALAFPNLLTNSSQEFLEFAEGGFHQHGFQVVSLSDLIHAIPPEERIVNLNDGHPSVRLNHAVGERLLDYCRRDYSDIP